jgi:phage-related holin
VCPQCQERIEECHVCGKSIIIPSLALVPPTQLPSASSLIDSTFWFDQLSKMILAILAVFAPVAQMINSLAFLVMVDAVTGVVAAHKQKEKITARKLSRTVIKFLVYVTTICVVHVANQYMLTVGNFVLPLESLVISFIALTELKSIFENMQRIQKQPILAALIDKISSSKSGIASTLDEGTSTNGTSNRPK